jgi:hypothetical protein
MISDFLVRLANLATNGTITQDEYTTIYNIIIEAERRQKSSVYKELAEKLNEQYKGKLVYERVGCYQYFGYPTFKADTDRIMMYFKPYYTYFNDSDKIESRFKKYNFTCLREDEIDARIRPITLEEMEEILKTFEGVDVEYVLNKFRDDPRRKNVVD